MPPVVQPVDVGDWHFGKLFFRDPFQAAVLAEEVLVFLRIEAVLGHLMLARQQAETVGLGNCHPEPVSPADGAVAPVRASRQVEISLEPDRPAMATSAVGLQHALGICVARSCPGDGRTLFEALIVGLGRRFPVFSVERMYRNGGQIDAIHAADVEGPQARVEPWADEGVDSAMPAEIVLRSIRVELVEHEIGFACEDTKIRLRCPVPQSTPAATQRAVTVDDIVELGSYLECDSTTVA